MHFPTSGIPIILEGRLQNGSIVEINPSGKKQGVVCYCTPEGAFGASGSQKRITIQDPLTGKKQNIIIDVRSLPKVQAVAKRQQDFAKIRGILQNKNIPTSSLDAVHRIFGNKIFKDLDVVEVAYKDSEGVEVGTQEIINFEGDWHPVDRKRRGGMLSASICEKIAVKHLMDNENLDDELLDAHITSQFLDRVNSSNDAIGIEKKPLASLEYRGFTKYNVSTQGAVASERIIRPIQVEQTFPCDCFEAIQKNLITSEEMTSLAASLVQGSSLLMKEEVYPLDVKLQNIAYLGTGRAAHIDLRGALDFKNSNWREYRITFQKNFCVKSEIDALEQEVSDKEKKNILHPKSI